MEYLLIRCTSVLGFSTWLWCFGFFFLELLDDCDEESNNDDALASLDDADRKLGSDSDKYVSFSSPHSLHNGLIVGSALNCL